MDSLDPPERALSPRRWREYVGALFPGLRLSRAKTDLCDRCVRIEIELKSPGITDERRMNLEAEQNVLLKDAIKQRTI